MQVNNTEALSIHVDCVPGRTSTATPTDDQGDFSFYSMLGGNDDCTVRTNSSSYWHTWFGVMYNVPSSCVKTINVDAPSTNNIGAWNLPVVISFVKNMTSTSAVYCYGYQKVYKVNATSDLNMGRVQSNITVGPYISGHPAEGYVYNG